MVTFIEGGDVVAQVTLDPSRSQTIRFGSAPDNDLVVNPVSKTVSSHHGTIYTKEGWCTLHDNGSLNGLFINGAKQDDFRITAGDIVSIGRPSRGARRCVIVVTVSQAHWSILPLLNMQSVSVGRDTSNDLVLDNVTVASHHALLQCGGNGGSSKTSEAPTAHT